MRARHLAVFTLGLAVDLQARAAGRHCLRYGPDTVTLKAQVIAPVFPGPPNYQHIRKGDARDRVLLLKVRDLSA